MFESWQLDTELADVCIGSGNWMRDETAQLDYTDLINIAELFSFIGQPEQSNLPPLHQVPAMVRFGIAAPSLETSMIILEQAKEDIAEVEQLLRG
ncbi:hypothetical protein [Pelagibaculum spongiae]|uniref:Uncharacterized protein n=1 Tax=Pelagibaculum spongiae TaxID=2080658 RepID=A0A2V1GUE6_9GAMM|nr:hypothetical protein [Pelagibaculum spongiae]PVZ66297.1 hypothetical protein DC094_16480 [Pelagibaculum spongiae]